MPKGQKLCKCGTWVAGPRTKICPNCKESMFEGTTILSENGEPVLITTRKVFAFPDGYDIPNVNIPLISTPSGVPPIKLEPGEDETEPSDNTILDWAGAVRQKMIDKGLYMKNSALAYWGRQAVGLKANIIKGMPDVESKEVPV